MSTMHRVFLAVLVGLSVSACDAEYEVRVLNEFDSRRALAAKFSTALPYVRSTQCTEYSFVEGIDLYRELTILTSCRFSMEERYFDRLSSELGVTPDSSKKVVPVVCPSEEEFSASEVYVAYGSVDDWGLNTAAMYTDSERAEYLICQKVRIVQ